ncbi:hypothetical protein [Arcicella rosea]|uniref:Uncharacterized protein n=1 Tax=Arcicella rosea TaxID=502909 RepID=A0A841ET22_9BACT|nr:hypothetical protein [Arcicella rosea]MBB6005494.1 hypothetical protein [Arcicella rosea]
MMVEFNNSIFDSNNFKGVNYLLQLCTYKSRYKVFVELTENIKGTSIFKNLNYDDQQLLIQEYNSIIQSQEAINPSCVICENLSTDQEFNIEEAIRYLIQPVSIILENSKNDSYFLKSIFKHFDTTGNTSRHLDNGWIQFENAGGCDNISNFLEGKLQSFNSLPKANKSIYLRCFVLMDSDKLHPNMDLSPTKQKTKNFIETHHIPYKILNKRSVENYLPIETYNQITNSSFDNWKASFYRLTDNQKDFLNIAIGFSRKNGNGTPKKDRNNVNGETNNLYDSLSQQDYDNLNQGLSQIGDFKTTFPTFFDSNYVSNTNLLEREGGTEVNNEFLEILQKINDLL